MSVPVSRLIPVAWGDMDAYGHVNNTVFLRWCETLRMDLFERIGLEHCRSEQGIGGILAAIQCRYRAPVIYPDTVRAWATIEDISESDFELKYRIWSTTQDRLAAEASDRIVIYDYRQMAKAPWPEAPLVALRELEFDQSWSEDGWDKN